MFKKKPSGYQYRLKKAAQEAKRAKICGTLDKFLVTKTRSDLTNISSNVSSSSNSDIESSSETPSTNVESCNLHKSDTTDEVTTVVEKSSKRDDEMSNSSMIPTDDPGTWPKILNSDVRSKIVERGPKQIKTHAFPVNDANRKFNPMHYTLTLANGVVVERKWLVYSQIVNAVFCFPCKIFSHRNIKLTQNGVNDWKNISAELKCHEISKDHLLCMKMWIDFERNLKSETMLNNRHLQQINEETRRWKNVLSRLFAITKFLAQRGLAFRGTNSKLNEPNNGNFLGLVQLLGEFDDVMADHIQRSLKHEINDTYVGKNIQNEMINIVGNSVKETILDRCRNAKYFAVMLDCTRDLSKTEQMTVILRYVHVQNHDVIIEERFVGYIEAVQSTGQKLTEIFLEFLAKCKLSIQDCRGQSYDNGANMKGIHQGVQKRILDLNSRAFFVPCVAHNLNLVLSDAVKSTIQGTSYFGFLGTLYNFFGSSSQRWAVLKKHVTNCTLKPLSGTRWEARIQSVKPVRFQPFEIFCAIQEISNNSEDNEVHFEAQSLTEYMSKFEFIVSTVIWYDILSSVNVVSKKLQSVSIELHSTIVEIEKAKAFLKRYRCEGFDNAVGIASEIAKENEFEAEFITLQSKRVRKSKRNFDYESRDEPILDAKEKFKIEFFYVVIDTAYSSLVHRCNQLEDHNNIFGFLYDISKINLASNDNLLKCCKDLQLALQHNGHQDIIAVELFQELRQLQSFLSNDIGPLETLNYIVNNQYEDIYPNSAIALRILLTIPITVASGERSFSKLRLVKSYTRSTMSDERLSNLAITSVESDLAALIDHEKMLSTFAAQKARHIPL